jgi:hypothetical protein
MTENASTSAPHGALSARCRPPHAPAGLRAAIVAALTEAAYRCSGDCGLNEHECLNNHPITWSGMVAGHTHITGGAADIADIVMKQLAAARTAEAKTPGICEIPHRTIEEEDDCERRRLAAGAERLTAERDQLGSDADRLRIDWVVMRERVEQVEDMLRIAHNTSNESEAARAHAERRAEKAEIAISQVRDLVADMRIFLPYGYTVGYATRIEAALDKVEERLPCPYCAGTPLFSHRDLTAHMNDRHAAVLELVRRGALDRVAEAAK